MKLTKKQLLCLAEILKAKEIKVSDRTVVNMRLWSVAYSWKGYNCTARIYEDDKGKYYVAKTHRAVVYVEHL